MRLALIRLTRPLRWRTPRSSARLLIRFAKAERSSFYDMMAAAQHAPDPTRRAQYLRHATDEARHAVMFTLRAKELDPTTEDPHADFEHLFATLGERRFVAFVHHGEKRGYQRLSRYRNEVDHKTQALLDAVLKDETQHVAYTGELLTQLDAWNELPKARLWEAARGWRRAGNALATLLFALLMRALYVLAFPIALAVKWRRS